ncbi:hypothetical protein BDK51DRAFT_25578 [Blyttiomyces helicus]|uniref:Uncharacterized protein n=1 Tax=Blyttiomyces helicus TaxID=388810 RepID=A0A4P9WS61_9FUNG|nr:hypothetical protein BDK51DRAFT_25578 [Blyttiomyces helicus]|eukprot:RKO93816.1 hypothetical protein BDK51DRAFT_25578 [Blyttiomyces helicus]
MPLPILCKVLQLHSARVVHSGLDVERGELLVQGLLVARQGMQHWQQQLQRRRSVRTLWPGPLLSCGKGSWWGRICALARPQWRGHHFMCAQMVLSRHGTLRLSWQGHVWRGEAAGLQASTFRWCCLHCRRGTEKIHSALVIVVGVVVSGRITIWHFVFLFPFRKVFIQWGQLLEKVLNLRVVRLDYANVQTTASQCCAWGEAGGSSFAASGQTI